MLKQVLELQHKRFGIAADSTLLVGFSQPVGLNYRFVATYPGAVRGVIGICGGVPRDWEEARYQPVDAAILHIARDEDEFYPVPVVTNFPDRLRTRASEVQFELLPGGHRFPSKARTIIEPWVKRIFSGTKSG